MQLAPTTTSDLRPTRGHTHCAADATLPCQRSTLHGAWSVNGSTGDKKRDSTETYTNKYPNTQTANPNETWVVGQARRRRRADTHSPLGTPEYVATLPFRHLTQSENKNQNQDQGGAPAGRPDRTQGRLPCPGKTEYLLVYTCLLAHGGAPLQQVPTTWEVVPTPARRRSTKRISRNRPRFQNSTGAPIQARVPRQASF